MVAARSAAMGFNRLVDARFDALNPRTAMRELPRGAMTRARGGGVRRRLVASSFVFAAWRLGPLCFVLSPVALAIVFWYSLAKRFTTYTQLFLGLAMAVAPVGGWLAAGGGGGWEPWLLGAGDRHLGRRLRRALRLPGSRRSIARTACDRFRSASACAASLAISRGMHVITVVCLAALGAGRDRSAGSTSPASAGVALLLVYEQSLVSEHDLSQVKRAFDLNGYVGILYLVVDRRRPSMSADSPTPIRSRWRSPARAARCTPRDAGGPARARLPHRADRHPTTAGGCCATSSANRRPSNELADYLAGSYGDGVRAARSPCTATAISARKIASGSQDCRAMVVVPCSMKTLAGIAHGLSRTLTERAADVMLKERRTLVIVPRETPMSLPQLRNMVLCAEAGAMIAAGDARVLSDAEDARRPRRLHGRQDPQRARLLSRPLSAMGELKSTSPRTNARPCRGCRQDPGADRGDVRRDRAALRPPQSRSQRRPRYALAGARDRRAAARPAARACSISAPAPATSRLRRCAAQPARVGRRRRFRRRDAAPGRPQDAARWAVGGRIAGPRRRHPHPARRRDLRRRDHRLRHPQRRRSARRARRDRARPHGRAAGSRFSSSASRACPGSGRCIAGISATCCRSSAAWSRSTRAPIRTCPRRSAPSRRPTSSSAPSRPQDFHRSGPSL